MNSSEIKSVFFYALFIPLGLLFFTGLLACYATTRIAMLACWALNMKRPDLLTRAIALINV